MKYDGFLIITDISGYTGFLTSAELEHASDILSSLFSTLLANIKPPMVVAKLEGDAIFAFSPEGSFLQGQTMLETLESIYYAFSTALQTMQLNTTCTCNACQQIPTLDLKFVVHHGSFLVGNVGGREELSGPAVITVHRLLKNSIVEDTGIKAYAFLTDAAAQAMALGELADSMVRHSESYEHIGEVSGYVVDLKPCVPRLRDRNRVFVSADDAWFTVTGELSAPPALVWDYLNMPNLRAQWLNVEGVYVTDKQKGRVEVGSTQHCAHGKGDTTPFEILDWRPFEYVTQELPTPMGGGKVKITTSLEPSGRGTRGTVSWSKPYGANPLVLGMVTAALRGPMMKEMKLCLCRLQALITEDAAAGRIVCELPTLALAEPA